MKNEKELTVICDVDDVIVEANEEFIGRLNNRLGKRVTHENLYPLSARSDGEEILKYHYECMDDPTFWASMKTIPGAKEYLSRIKNELGGRILFSTGRPLSASTESDLASRGIPFDQVHLAYDPSDWMNPGNYTKDGFIDHIQPDFVIEDSPEMIPKTLLSKISTPHVGPRVILFNQPWTFGEGPISSDKAHAYSGIKTTAPYIGRDTQWRETFEYIQANYKS